MIGKNLIKNITRKLREKKLSISLAESCTGGMLSSAFTSESGSSKVFKMGLVTYSNQSKNLLNKLFNPNFFLLYLLFKKSYPP